MEKDLIVEQKYLGKIGLIFLIAVMNMAPPLSIDMYLPALPNMTDYFSASAGVVNITLVGFFFFFALGILFLGPISDKYGRKPVLLFGLVFYFVFSGLCAVAVSIWQLIIFRVFQAIGAGCMVAVSTALIKDSFSGKFRDTVLAVVQAMSVIAPMVAPILGAFILKFASWRATFWVLAVIALICLVATLLLEETLDKEERYNGSVFSALGRLLVVGRNKDFSGFLIIVSLLAAPYMAYIAICSYVYIDYFGLSEGKYSIFFAINSAISILGPLAYIKVNGKLTPIKIMKLCFIIAGISGVGILLFGKISPLVFLVAFLPFTFVESGIRPFSTSILLDMQEGDTGSASSLINFIQSLLGSIGMMIGAIPWANYISGLGIIMLSFTAVSILCWILFIKTDRSITK